MNKYYNKEKNIYINMAISKNTVQKTRKPESLYEIPAEDYRGASCNCNCGSGDSGHKSVELYDSYDEAVIACSRVFLKPGEVHTEFYKEDGVYHCVIAIGNINPNKGHLYLQDMGDGEVSVNEILNKALEQSTKALNVANADAKKFTEFADTLKAHSISIKDLNDELKSLINDVDDLDNAFGEEVKRFDDLKKVVDDHEARITKLEESVTGFVNDVQDISSRLNSATVDINNELTVKIENALKEIDSENNTIIIEKVNEFTKDIDNRVDTLSETVETLDGAVKDTLEEIQDLSTLVNSKVVNIDNVMNIMNTSINSAFDHLANYIADPSIDSLFSKDIYTVNLCCYTDAGYVTIDDDYDTNGNYRTYVKGDAVTLTAYRKVGYNFKHWYRNSSHKSWDSSVLKLNFKECDINVIATTTEDPEAYDDKNRYTAIFSRMNRVNKRIEIINKDEAEILTGDNIWVDGLAEEPCYFNDNARIKLRAVPVNTNHIFKYFIINGQRINDPVYMFERISSDINVTAFFEELRYHLHAEPNRAEYGDVECNKPTTVLPGTIAKIKAIPATGYVFDHWEKLNVDTNTYEFLSSNPELSYEVNDYSEIKAVFNTAS